MMYTDYLLASNYSPALRHLPQTSCQPLQALFQK
jgi:hypothetical protein